MNYNNSNNKNNKKYYNDNNKYDEQYYYTGSAKGSNQFNRNQYKNQQYNSNYYEVVYERKENNSNNNNNNNTGTLENSQQQLQQTQKQQDQQKTQEEKKKEKNEQAQEKYNQNEEEPTINKKYNNNNSSYQNKKYYNNNSYYQKKNYDNQSQFEVCFVEKKKSEVSENITLSEKNEEQQQQQENVDFFVNQTKKFDKENNQRNRKEFQQKEEKSIIKKEQEQSQFQEQTQQSQNKNEDQQQQEDKVSQQQKNQSIKNNQQRQESKMTTGQNIENNNQSQNLQNENVDNAKKEKQQSDSNEENYYSSEKKNRGEGDGSGSNSKYKLIKNQKKQQLQQQLLDQENENENQQQQQQQKTGKKNKKKISNNQNEKQQQNNNNSQNFSNNKNSNNNNRNQYYNNNDDFYYQNNNGQQYRRQNKYQNYYNEDDKYYDDYEYYDDYDYNNDDYHNNKSRTKNQNNYYQNNKNNNNKTYYEDYGYNQYYDEYDYDKDYYEYYEDDYGYYDDDYYDNNNKKKQRDQEEVMFVQKKYQKKVQFQNYFTLEQTEEGIKLKQLYRGIFLSNERSRYLAQIRCEDIQQKIYINELEPQNRALHGNTVIFKLIKETKIYDKLSPKTNKSQNTSNANSPEKNLAINNAQNAIINNSVSKEPQSIINNNSDDKNVNLQQLENNQDQTQQNFVSKVPQSIINKNSDDTNINLQQQENNQDQTQQLQQQFSDITKPSAQEEDKNVSNQQQQQIEQTKNSANQITQTEYDEEQVLQISNSLSENEEEKCEKYLAEVVRIEKNQFLEKKFVCYLKMHQRVINILRKKLKTQKINSIQNILNDIFILPIDKKLPWMKFIIDENFKPRLSELLQNGTAQDYYYFAKFNDWKQDNYYPEACLVEEIGKKGEIETECIALLMENQVNMDDFQQKSIDYMEQTYFPQLDANKEFIISNEERQKRLDLTKEIICTIDPATARDLDDAVSIKQIEEGLYEIGVHIADVSYFVKENSLLDEEAKARTTSIYLPQRVIPMLPRLLCENLCSINPNQERLALSCYFKMKENGELIEEKGNEVNQVHKTIIKSCIKMSYNVAQQIIDNQIKTYEDFPENQKPQNVDVQQLIQNIKLLNVIAKGRRKLREINGSIFFDKNKFHFQLDETGYPLSYSREEKLQSKSMIEEFMLIANMITGQAMINFDQKNSILRKHEDPQQKKIQYIQQLTEKLNVEINYTSSKELQSSLVKLQNNNNILAEYKEIITYQVKKILQSAQYLIVSDTEKQEWHHYALNFDIYTHFTSPIRRYPDILVHRFLYKIIESRVSSQQEKINDESIQNNQIQNNNEIIDKCNEQKLASRRVGDGCQKIFMCICLKKQPLEFIDAFVLSYGQKSITLIIPFLNIDKRLDFKNYRSIESVIFDDNEKKNQLALKIKNDQQQEPLTFIIKLFQAIKVVISAIDSFPIDYQIQMAFLDKNNDSLQYTIIE